MLTPRLFTILLGVIMLGAGYLINPGNTQAADLTVPWQSGGDTWYISSGNYDNVIFPINEDSSGGKRLEIRHSSIINNIVFAEGSNNYNSIASNGYLNSNVTVINPVIVGSATGRQSLGVHFRGGINFQGGIGFAGLGGSFSFNYSDQTYSVTDINTKISSFDGISNRISVGRANVTIDNAIDFTGSMQNFTVTQHTNQEPYGRLLLPHGITFGGTGSNNFILESGPLTTHINSVSGTAANSLIAHAGAALNISNTINLNGAGANIHLQKYGELNLNGGVAFSGAGTKTLSSDVGSNTVNVTSFGGSGTNIVQTTGSGSLTIANAINLSADGHNVQFNRGGGAINTTGTVTFSGSGTKTLAAGQGTTTINSIVAGGSGVNNLATSGTGSLNISNAVALNANGSNIHLVKNGGNINLSGGVTFSGTGTKTLASDVGANTVASVTAGGTGINNLQTSGSATLAITNAVALNADGGNIHLVKNGGNIGLNGGVIFSGTGTKTLASDAGANTVASVTAGGTGVNNLQTSGTGSLAITNAIALNANGSNIHLRKGGGDINLNGGVAFSGAGTKTLAADVGASTVASVSAGGTGINNLETSGTGNLTISNAVNLSADGNNIHLRKGGGNITLAGGVNFSGTGDKVLASDLGNNTVSSVTTNSNANNYLATTGTATLTVNQANINSGSTLRTLRQGGLLSILTANFTGSGDKSIVADAGNTNIGSIALNGTGNNILATTSTGSITVDSITELSKSGDNLHLVKNGSDIKLTGIRFSGTGDKAVYSDAGINEISNVYATGTGNNYLVTTGTAGLSVTNIVYLQGDESNIIFQNSGNSLHVNRLAYEAEQYTQTAAVIDGHVSITRLEASGLSNSVLATQDDGSVTVDAVHFDTDGQNLNLRNLGNGLTIQTVNYANDGDKTLNAQAGLSTIETVKAGGSGNNYLQSSDDGAMQVNYVYFSEQDGSFVNNSNLTLRKLGGDIIIDNAVFTGQTDKTLKADSNEVYVNNILASGSGNNYLKTADTGSFFVRNVQFNNDNNVYENDSSLILRNEGENIVIAEVNFGIDDISNNTNKTLLADVGISHIEKVVVGGMGNNYLATADSGKIIVTDSLELSSDGHNIILQNQGEGILIASANFGGTGDKTIKAELGLSHIEMINQDGTGNNYLETADNGGLSVEYVNLTGDGHNIFLRNQGQSISINNAIIAGDGDKMLVAESGVSNIANSYINSTGNNYFSTTGDGSLVVDETSLYNSSIILKQGGDHLALNKVYFDGAGKNRLESAEGNSLIGSVRLGSESLNYFKTSNSGQLNITVANLDGDGSNITLEQDGDSLNIMNVNTSGDGDKFITASTGHSSINNLDIKNGGNTIIASNNTASLEINTASLKGEISAMLIEQNGGEITFDTVNMQATESGTITSLAGSPVIDNLYAKGAHDAYLTALNDSSLQVNNASIIEDARMLVNENVNINNLTLNNGSFALAGSLRQFNLNSIDASHGSNEMTFRMASFDERDTIRIAPGGSAIGQAQLNLVYDIAALDTHEKRFNIDLIYSNPESIKTLNLTHPDTYTFGVWDYDAMSEWEEKDDIYKLKLIRFGVNREASNASGATIMGGMGTMVKFIDASQTTLLQRMDDIRFDDSMYGKGSRYNSLWARTFANQSYMDDYTGTDITLYGLEMGYDRLIDLNKCGRLYVGALAGFGQANGSFTESGKATMEMPSLGVYGTWVLPKDFYFSLIGRHYFASVDSHSQAPGRSSLSYETNQGVNSLVFEAGKRFHLNDKRWYVQPRIKYNFAQIDGIEEWQKDIDMLADDYSSHMLTAGVKVGNFSNTSAGKNTLELFGKLDIKQQFGSEVNAQVRGRGHYEFGSDTEIPAVVRDYSFDYDETRVELGFGGNVSLNQRLKLHFQASVEKGDITTSFGGNAGLTFEF